MPKGDKGGNKKKGDAGAKKSTASSGGGGGGGSAAEAPRASVASQKESAVVDMKANKRAELKTPAFMVEVDKLTEKFMKPVSKKDDQRKAAKADVKQALQTCLDLSSAALKRCGTAPAQYLLEHIQADAEKLKIHLAQDEDYIEEVRFKHNKMMDLLDDVRAYDAVNLQKDLVRNREIRAKCYQLTHGDTPPENLVDEDELNELMKIRNSIRTWYGGQNMLKGMGGLTKAGDDDKLLFQVNPSEIKVASGKVA